MEISANAGDALCQQCGASNPCWFAPHDLWNRVVGGPDAKDDPGGVLCPTCFGIKAQEAGVGTLVMQEDRHG